MKPEPFAIRTFVFLIAPVVVCLMILSTSIRAEADAFASVTNDPYIWLEDVNGSNAMKWVRAENEKTLAVLEKDPRFETFYSEALKISEAKDRIPEPEIVHGEVLNFWQDAEHVRGIWRRTTLDNYQTDSPQWTTILDLDELAKSEKADWVWEGAEFDEPQQTRCMVSLSEGGEDATTDREFDFSSGHFVENGFRLPRGKHNFAWEDSDTLLVSIALTTNELTQSGYPYVVRRLKRGQALESAPVVFRGKQTDSDGVYPFAMADGTGHEALFISRGLTHFETDYYTEREGSFVKLALPLKLSFEALVDRKLVLLLNEDWTSKSGTVRAGSVVSINLEAAKQNPAAFEPAIIFSPGPREGSVRRYGVAAATRDAVVLTILDNVRGRAFLSRSGAGGTWSRTRLDFPDNMSISIADADIHSDAAIFDLEGFLQPSSLWLADTRTEKLKLIKTLPAMFDASRDVVEQFEAASTDGVKIPYFVVHPKDMKLNGDNPTLMTAYGGFQDSQTPHYLQTLGKLWLERGGVFVLANIRGGGEFGSAWHEATLKTHRQIIYDDFASVARDLIARKITRPRRLGILGASAGGLLMGVEFTQHPTLWNAVGIGVPLLDMERYEKIQAGASWVAEYGSMSNPQEAAFLRSISPYANLRRGQSYPQPFIWTASNDDRVGPQHARKFAARLAEYGIPYYFYEATEGGHGPSANYKEQARATALRTTYFTRKLMDN